MERVTIRTPLGFRSYVWVHNGLAPIEEVLSNEALSLRLQLFSQSLSRQSWVKDLFMRSNETMAQEWIEYKWLYQSQS